MVNHVLANVFANKAFWHATHGDLATPPGTDAARKRSRPFDDEDDDPADAEDGQVASQADVHAEEDSHCLVLWAAKSEQSTLSPQQASAGVGSVGLQEEVSIRR
jgi:hypothetical protein